MKTTYTINKVSFDILQIYCLPFNSTSVTPLEVQSFFHSIPKQLFHLHSSQVAWSAMETTATATKPRPYKWINEKIAKLNPYKDYVEIWRLSTEYAGNKEFIQNLVYATTFSDFNSTSWGPEAVWRDDRGKTIYGLTERQYQTQLNISIWWYHALTILVPRTLPSYQQDS